MLLQLFKSHMHILFTDRHYSKHPTNSFCGLVLSGWLMSFTTAASFTATIIIAPYSFTNIINLYFITLIYEYYKMKIISVPTDRTLAFLLKTYLKTPRKTFLGCFAAWVDCSIHLFWDYLSVPSSMVKKFNKNTRKHVSTPSQHFLFFINKA